MSFLCKKTAFLFADIKKTLTFALALRYKQSENIEILVR